MSKQNNSNNKSTDPSNNNKDVNFFPPPPPMNVGTPGGNPSVGSSNIHDPNEIFDTIMNTHEQGGNVQEVIKSMAYNLGKDASRIVFNTAVDKATQAIANKINNRGGGGKGTKTGTGTVGGSGSTGGKGGGRGRGGNGNGTPGSNDSIPNSLPHTHTGLADGFPPTEIRLSTGISPNCSGENYHRAIQDKVSPLHMTGAIATISALPANNYVSDFMSKVVLTNFKTKLQRAISFSIPTSITDANIIAALDAMFEALQFYYFADATLQYASNPANWNEGILNLRTSMTSTDLNYMYSLRRILQSLPIPPNMRQFAFYLMQIYATGSVPGAPLIRICPIQCVDNSLGLITYSTSFTNSINKLISYSNVYNVIAAACPHWVNEDLEHGFTVPVHDNNFSTIFANLAYQGVSNISGSSYTYTGPSATTAVDDINYNSYTDNLDGLAYCCTSVYVTSVSNYFPGLVVPVVSKSQTVSTTAAVTNRMSWYDLGSGAKWVDSFMNVNYKISLSRGETYACSGWNNYQDSILNFGAELCLGVNANAISQTTLSAIDWLISLDSMSKPGNRKWGGK